MKRTGMRKLGVWACVVLGAATDFAAGSAGVPEKGRDVPKLTVEWGRPQSVDRGDYPRLRVLADGRYALVYSQLRPVPGAGRALSALIRYSSDRGATWSAAEPVIAPPVVKDSDGTDLAVNPANSELTQLSPKHPKRPGRLVYSVNLRPNRNRSSVFPFSIAYKVSDDAGRTWSELRTPYKAPLWPDDAFRGCWEPYVQELPDGTLHLYFSDETPYWKRGCSDQNISYLVSTDGGETWSGPRIAAYTAGGRDGMPVTMVLGGRLYLSIEAPHADHLNWPLRQRIVSTDVADPWREPVLGHSPFRYDPIVPSLGADQYGGAPYLVQTERYLLLSGQFAKTRPHEKRSIVSWTTWPVWTMRKDEVGPAGELASFRDPTCPLGDANPVCWSSLTALSGDEVMAVLCNQSHGFDSTITLVRGRVRETDGTSLGE